MHPRVQQEMPLADRRVLQYKGLRRCGVHPDPRAHFVLTMLTPRSEGIKRRGSPSPGTGDARGGLRRVVVQEDDPRAKRCGVLGLRHWRAMVRRGAPRGWSWR